MARADRPVLLSTDRHDRDAAGLTYVYPVVSRRAGGVSVGINLNPNNACNWRCAYCQVPGLVRGRAPEIDTERLARELRGLLGEILDGDFLREHVPEGDRRLRDIAISGNGEPTSCRRFDAIVECVGQVMDALGLVGRLPLVLITNGSGIRRKTVERGLGRLATLGGEAWVKVDSATCEGLWRINGVHRDPIRLAEGVTACARLCPTWIQTCQMLWDGRPPPEEEQAAYLDLVAGLVEHGTPLEGIRLYGLARPSLQPDADHLGRLDADWLEGFAERIRRRTGLTVLVTP